MANPKNFSECLACKKTFLYAKCLVNHYSEVHLRRKCDINYLCAHCEKGYTNLSNAKKHCAITHPRVTSQNDKVVLQINFNTN